jgi:RNA-binding protein
LRDQNLLASRSASRQIDGMSEVRKVISRRADHKKERVMTKETSPSGSELKGYQRRYLRGLANPLKALVQVGESGLSDSLIKALDEALEHHELVKVRLQQPPDKKASAKELAERTSAEICGLVGHTVILYRKNPKEPKIELPLHS